MKLKEFEELYGKANLAINNEGMFTIYVNDPKVCGSGKTLSEAIQDLLKLFKEIKKVNI